MSAQYTSQNDLLLHNCMQFYKNSQYLDKMLGIINGDSKISLRIVDWFATNYAKKNFTVYELVNGKTTRRMKVYNDYKLKLKAYSKRRFDPFCRWERISVPYKDGTSIQTTIGQLNFFKWAIESGVVEYIEKHYQEIEEDMNSRNSNSRKRTDKSSCTDNPIPQELVPSTPTDNGDLANKTRKRREELSVLASKSIKKEDVEIVVKFN